MINVDVRNSGEHAGDEVVQLYVRDTIATLTRPMKELKGFCRVSLQPGIRDPLDRRPSHLADSPHRATRQVPDSVQIEHVACASRAASP